MIFKQRLFTVLLGLLFTTVLTGQASALYDPGVGRFCSRDPIGFVGSDWNFYEFLHGVVLNRTDPKGLDDADRIYREKCKLDEILPCDRTLEEHLAEYCRAQCLTSILSLLNLPPNLQGNATMFGQQCANAAFPPTPQNPNPVENQAIRHCAATAYVRCHGNLDGICALCLANERENYQRMCADQSCSATLRAKNNNGTGALGSAVGCGSICEDCTKLFRDGKLDTRPEIDDKDNNDRECDWQPTKGNKQNPGRPVFPPIL